MGEPYIEINCRQLADNARAIMAQAQKGLIAVVKSNAYGLGDKQVAKALTQAGVKYLAVVNVNEAKGLIAENPPAAILILNSVDAADLPVVNDCPQITLTVNSSDDARLLANYPFTRVVNVHLKIDTGMNRLGLVAPTDAVLGLLLTAPKLRIEGICTHFTDADNMARQLRLFTPEIARYPYPMIHCAASSTWRRCPVGNYVRVGLDIYGDGLGSPQAIKIACKALDIKTLPAGTDVGYNRRYQTQTIERIAVLPIGYHDGFRRALQGYPVMVKDKMYETVGTVCMNHIFVRVDDTVGLDDEFVITGPAHPLAGIAEYLKTVPHEVLCMFRIKNRRYVENDLS